MKLFGSLLTAAAAFGAGFWAHRRLTEKDEAYTAPTDPVEAEAQDEAELDGQIDWAENDLAGEEDDTDPKLIEAVDLIVAEQKVATSLMQRRLGIGYGRAAKMIDTMEKLGYVSPCDGHSPRKVLITAEEWKEARSDLNEFLGSDKEA